MDDHQPHYESKPERSLTQWIKSQPLSDRRSLKLALEHARN
jgi:hypothetical protein